MGDTKDMNGHVFQIHSEQRKKNQFNDTMDALKTYASQKYVKHIDYLTPLFVDLSVPEIRRPVPVAKNMVEVTMPDGTKKEIADMDTVEEEEFRYKAKAYAKESAAFKSTVRSLFNVIWGQCSQMMKRKLKGDENMKKVEKDGNAAELLKMIRGVSREIDMNASIYDAIDEAK